jgi:3-hydroxybutyrate dehydrogenase
MSIAGIKNKVVLVTGASRGVGLGVARGFAAERARLHILATDDKVLAAARKIGATGHIADITKADDVNRVMASIGPLDILVNNAGLERLTPLDDASADNEATFRRIMDINVVGTFLMTRAAAAQMGKGGSIINSASVWSRGSEARFAAYVASKHATIGLTKTWAKELGPRGIRVNAVCPGWVKTDASMLSLKRMSENSGRNEADLLADITGAQILPGLMEPDDVAGPYLFLASDLAANVTGQSLGIDRGEFPW